MMPQVLGPLPPMCEVRMQFWKILSFSLIKRTGEGRGETNLKREKKIPLTGAVPVFSDRL